MLPLFNWHKKVIATVFLKGFIVEGFYCTLNCIFESWWLGNLIRWEVDEAVLLIESRRRDGEAAGDNFLIKPHKKIENYPSFFCT